MFYKNRIQYKLKMIDEQIEINNANLNIALENSEIGDIKAFTEINKMLWETKEDLMKKETTFD